MLHKPTAMIGIEITQEIKDRNKAVGPVGSIYTRSSYPNVWWGKERVSGGYAGREDLHKADGWKPVVKPAPGENQKVDAIEYDEEFDRFTYTLVDLTEAEIKARYEISMPRSQFKLALLDKHGITNGHVTSLFEALVQSDPAMEVPVERMKILWNESEVFSNTTPELFQFANMMDSIAGVDLSEEDLKQIFIDYKNGL